MAKMKAKQRNKLPKKLFGIPSKRKFPLNDQAHVKAAVRLFGRASDADKPALARKILRRAKELGMDSSGWKTVHEWAKKSSTVKEYAVLSEFSHYFNEEEELLFPDEDITIRKAIKDDLDFIVEMEMSTFSDKTKSLYPGIRKYCERDAKKYLNDTEIIMDDDERIGIYMAYMDGDVWFISSIALLPEYQNKGIGSALIQHDIDTHDRIQLYVDIYNDKAKKLYEKLGFRVVEHDDDHWIMELDKKNDVKLVDATNDDIDYIYECEMETLPSDEKNNPKFEDEVKKDAADSVDVTKIITLNGRRVGIYQAHPTNKWGLKEGDKDWWYIAEIYLSPDVRGKGIGTSIIQSDISDHDKLLLNVYKDNKKAIKLYKRLGFEIDKELDNRYVMRLVKNTVQETYIDKNDKLIPVENYSFDTVYMGTPTEKIPKKDLYFIAQYMSTASIFIGRDKVIPELKKRGIHSFNLGYKEWGSRNNHPLKVVHVIVNSGNRMSVDIPYFKPFEFTASGYLHTINVSSMKDHIYRYDWMSKSCEAIVSGVDKLDVKKTEKVSITYKVCHEKDVSEIKQESATDEKDVDLSVSFIKEVIKKIHDKTKKDSKPPTGNQNCQICTWCLEAQCRGIDALPRAVYSPRDKGLAIKGETIVIDPVKIHIKDKNDVLSKVKEAGDNSRFWVHVNWKDSKGGHEFMLMNIESKVYIVDAQQNTMIEFGSKENDYFDDINYSNSYIVRLDDKKLNKELLKEATDESRTLPWDEKKDTEYMRKEGMLGENEHIQESYRDEHFNKLYFHISPESYLDGQVFKPRVPEYLDRYDPEDKNFENDTTPRVCFSPSIEGCLNGIMVNMPRVNVMPKTKFYVYIPEKPFHEYKHKTNKELIRDKDIFDASVTDEVWILEPVRMKLYGVIEIDSVTNVKRKQNVPTASGKTSTRPYYKYKWHWLVKPKVLKKGTKFDYSVPRVIENLCMELPKFRYGLIRDGRLQSGNVSESDYNKYWVVHTPEEIDEAGGGNCYDMVEYEAGYLDSYGIECNKYYVALVQNKPKYRCDTHTFIVVKNDGKYIYIEQAFKRVVDEIGNSKEFDKLEDVFKYVIECMCEYADKSDWEYETIWDYTDIKFKKGTPMENFTNYITTNGDIVYEGKVNDKSDNKKKESDSE